MKVNFEDDLIIIYLYNYDLSINDTNELTKQIKELLISLIKRYNISISGMYEVVVYENLFYGFILEIKRIKEFEYNDYVDIKLLIKHNAIFYLEFDDYFIILDEKEIFYKNNKFYVNINKISDVNKVIEYAKIIYKKEILNINDCVKIKDESVN